MIVSIFNYHFILSYYHVVYHMLLSSCCKRLRDATIVVQTRVFSFVIKKR